MGWSTCGRGKMGSVNRDATGQVSYLHHSRLRHSTILPGSVLNWDENVLYLGSFLNGRYNISITPA